MNIKKAHMHDSINRKQLIKDIMRNTEQKLYRNPEVVLVCALALPAVWLFFVLCLVL
jgi:hypothetical protein